MAPAKSEAEKKRGLVETLAPVAYEIFQAAKPGEIAFVVRPPLSEAFTIGFERLLNTKLDSARTTTVLFGPSIAEAGWDLVTRAWMQRPTNEGQLRVFLLDRGVSALVTLTFKARGKDFTIATESGLRQ
jgi:hypothetical protein